MKAILKKLLFYSGLVLFANYLFSPIYAIFVEKIGGSVETAGLAYGVYSLTVAILLIVIGKWEDHMKHREPLLILASSLAFVGFSSYLFVANIEQFMLAQVILGIATAIALPTFDASYSENLDEGRHASEWSIWESMNFLITALAATIGGTIVSLWGFNALFILMSFFSLFSFFIALSLVSFKK